MSTIEELRQRVAHTDLEDPMLLRVADELEAAQKRVESLEQALKGIKLYALSTNQPGHLALAHIVRLCINAGVTQKLDELQLTP